MKQVVAAALAVASLTLAGREAVRQCLKEVAGQAHPRMAMRLLLRAIVVVAMVGLYAAAVLTDEHPAVVALGFAPLAWLALEAGWRLFG
jgi:hypothetical protein